MGLFGRRTDDAFVQSFNRAFDPIRHEKLQLLKKELNASLKQKNADIQVASELANMLSEEDTNERDYKQSIDFLREFQNVAKIPNTIRKPALNAWVNRVEQKIGKPLSPVLKEVISKGSAEDMDVLFNSIIDSAQGDAQFNSDKLISTMTNDEAVMKVVLPKAGQIQPDEETGKGTIKPAPQRTKELAVLERKQQSLLRQKERLNNVLSHAHQRGASADIVDRIQGHIERVDDQLDDVQTRSESIRDKMVERQTKRTDTIAAERRAEESTKRKEQRELERIRQEMALKDEIDFVLDRVEQLERQRAVADDPRQQELLDRRLETRRAQLRSLTAGRGSQVTGVDIGLMGQTLEEDLPALRDKKIALESFSVKALRYKEYLTDNPGAKTYLADAARVAKAIEANIKTVLPGWEFDLKDNVITSYTPEGEKKVLHLDPDEFEFAENGLTRLAKASAVERSMAIAMAFQIAFMRGQTGKALSDRDLALFMQEVAFNEQDPEISLDVINHKVLELKDEFEIEWKNRAFGENGEPLPVPTYNVDFNKFRRPTEAPVQRGGGGRVIQEGDRLRY